MRLSRLPDVLGQTGFAGRRAIEPVAGGGERLVLGACHRAGQLRGAGPDGAVASATSAGLPLVRLLAIWLRGADSTGGGDGAYQYVEVANLGGAPQDLTGWSLEGDSGSVIGLTYYFPAGFTLNPGDSCRVYVDHPAEATCTDGSFALYQFWGDHGTAVLLDDQQQVVDSLSY